MKNLCLWFYKCIIWIGGCLQAPLLLAMRLYWGYEFFITGLGKFSDHAKTAEFFASLNIPYPELNAFAVAFFETFGGLFLIVGLLSRLVCIPLITILCTAFATAHHAALVNIFNDPDAFFAQAPYNFLVMTLVVFSFGPGPISIDHFLRKKYLDVKPPSS